MHGLPYISVGISESCQTAGSFAGHASGCQIRPVQRLVRLAKTSPAHEIHVPRQRTTLFVSRCMLQEYSQRLDQVDRYRWQSGSSLPNLMKRSIDDAVEVGTICDHREPALRSHAIPRREVSPHQVKQPG
jgi:hypothetical protein